MFGGIRLGSLRTKIIAWSFVPAAIVLSAVALVAFYAYQRSTADLVVAKNRELVRLSAGQVAGEMSEYTGDLATLARTLSIYASSPPAQADALRKAANRVVVFDGGVVVLDNHGFVAAAQPERAEILDQDWSNRPYFQELLRTQGPAFSDAVSDGPDGAPVIVVAVPITGDRGEFLGAALGMFRTGQTAVSSFYGSLVKLRIAPSDIAYLVDEKGRVIYHADATHIGEDFSGQGAVQEVMRGRAGAQRTRNVSGREIVASYAPVPGTPWGLVIEADWRALLQPSRGYRQFLLALLALGVVIPAVVVAVSSRRITKPIGDLIGAAKAVASGNFGQTVSASTGDEVEELVTQFNLMSVELASSYNALRDRNEQLELIMRSSNDGIWDWDLRTNQTYFSTRWKGILGYTDEEITNEFESWRNLLHPGDVQPTLAALDAYFEGRNPVYSPEFRLRHKDGSYRWILARGMALRDADGKLYRMVGSHTDITEQKRVQAILAGQRHFLELLARGESFGQTLDALVRSIEEQSPGMMGLVRLAEEDGGAAAEADGRRLRCVAAPSLPAELVAAIDADPEGGGGTTDACGAAAATGQRVIVEDIAADSPSEGGAHPDPHADSRDSLAPAPPVPAMPHGPGLQGAGQAGEEGPGSRLGMRALALRHGLRACWSEPIFSQPAGGRAVGAFAMYSLEPRAPTESELRMVETAARLVGIALEHQQAQEAIRAAYQTLERRVEERTRELATLNAIATVVSRSLDLQEILEAALDQTMEAMGMPVGVAYRLDGDPAEPLERQPSPTPLLGPAPPAAPRPGVLVIMAHRGLSQEVMRQIARVPLHGSIVEDPVPFGAERVAAVGEPATWKVADHPNPVVRQALIGGGLRQTVSVPLMSKGRMLGTLFLAASEERSLGPEELSLLAAIGQQVGVALENAYLYHAEQAGRAEAERRRLVAEGLRETLDLLNSRQSLTDTLDHIVSQACRLLGSDATALMRLEEPGGPQSPSGMAIQAACGLEEEYVKGIKLTLATAGAALTERRPVQVADVGVVEEGVWANPDRYLPPDADRPLWRRFLEDFRAFLLVPLIIRDEVYGVIALQYRRPHRFSEEEVRLASTVANQAALAIESARLREQAQQAAAVAERTRLARELHDSVTQSLYSVTLYAEAAARLLTNGQEVQASDYLREVRDTALEALREMRLLIFELRPPALQEVGLVGALQARLQAVEERAGIHVALDVSGSPEAAGFSIAVQTELYYLLKEALNNALKHARARQVWVDLCFDAPEPYFEVRDDGVGFEPVEAEAGGGLGMEGMRERSQRIHAQLEIRSRPLAGSTVRVQLSPLGIVRA